MRKKTLLLSGAIFVATSLVANAQPVIIPYVKSGGNWVSLLTYYVAAPMYGGTPGQLNITHVHKPDWDGFSKLTGSGSYAQATCGSTSFTFTTVDSDVTTIDISSSNKLGFPGNVMASNYEAANSKPSSISAPSGTTDGYLVIDDGLTSDVGTTLTAEAVVFDMVTGMFFYQNGISVYPEGNLPDHDYDDIGYGSVLANLIFQGEDFATTSIYYIPGDGDEIRWFETAVSQPTGSIVMNAIVNRKGEAVRDDDPANQTEVEVKCLALVPIKELMRDTEWASVGRSGGVAFVYDTQGGIVDFGIMYKGEVYKIGRTPNIFSPLKNYANSSVYFQTYGPMF